MKAFILILSIYSLNLMAQGRFSDSERIVVCDIPLEEYEEFQVNGYFETSSLYTEGFIHCARPSQLEYVMNKYFDKERYVLFVSTKEILGSDLIYEGSDPTNTYPHLYRRFYASDSIAEIIVSRNRQAQFVLPEEFRSK